MLTFLAIAAKSRLTVDAYEDNAVAILDKNTGGKLAVTKTILRPKVTFAAATPATAIDNRSWGRLWTSWMKPFPSVPRTR